MVTRRGRGKTVCARVAYLALLGGPSTSPLGVVLDARWVPVGLVVLLAAAGLLVVLLRQPTYVATGSLFIPNPANATVVICRGWDEAELSKILADFARSYKNRLPSAQPFSVERRPDQFRIRFPADIAPPLLSFLVNYLQYPKDFDVTNRQIAAVGIVTLTNAFPVPRDDYVGKEARIYVPSNDHTYDEVYIAVGSEYFRESFTNMVWKPSPDGRIPDAINGLQ